MNPVGCRKPGILAGRVRSGQDFRGSSPGPKIATVSRHKTPGLMKALVGLSLEGYNSLNVRLQFQSIRQASQLIYYGTKTEREFCHYALRSVSE